MKKLVVLLSLFLLVCGSVYAQEKQFLLRTDEKGNLRVEYDTSYHDVGIRISESAVKYLDSVPIILRRGFVSVGKKHNEFVGMVSLSQYRDREVIEQPIILVNGVIRCTGKMIVYRGGDKPATFLIFFIISILFFSFYNLGIGKNLSWWFSLASFIIFLGFPVFDSLRFDWTSYIPLFIAGLSHALTGNKKRRMMYGIFSTLYYGSMSAFLFLIFIF